MKKQYRETGKKKIKVETSRAKNTRVLPDRAASASRSLSLLNAIFAHLFSDENFITLLEAESMTMIPDCLQPVFEEARNEHEVGL